MRRQIRAKCLWPLVFGLLAASGLNAASSAISVHSDRSQRLTLGPGESVDVRAVNSSNQDQILIVSRQTVDVSLDLHGFADGHLSHPVLGNSSDYVRVAPNSELRLRLAVTDPLSPPGEVSLTMVSSVADEIAVRSIVELMRLASLDYRKGTRATMQSAFKGYASVAVLVQKSKNSLLRNITAQANHAAGEIAFALQDSDNTVKHLEKAALQFKALGETDIAAVALSSLGLWHLLQSHYDKAISTFTEATETLGAGDPIVRNRIQFNGCLVQLELLALAAAEHCFEASSKMASQLSDTTIEIASNEAQAGVYSKRGQHDRALQLLLRELKRWQESDNDQRQALAHNNVAIQYRRLGDMQNALNHYQQALTLFAASGNELAQVTALRNIARAYFLSGNYERAEEFAEESLARAHQSGNKRAQARSLLRVAEIQRKTGRIDEASKHYDTAEILAHEFSDEKMLFDIQSARARLSLAVGRPKQALSLLNTAKALRESFAGSPVDFGDIALARARVLIEQDKQRAAKQALDEAFLAMEKANYPLGIALAHELAGSLALKTGQLEQAKSHATDAIRTFDAIRGSLASLDLRANYGANQVDAYAILIDASMQQAKQLADPEYATKAFEFVTQSRAQTLSEVLAQGQGNAEIPDELLQERNEMVQRISQFKDAAALDTADRSLARELIALDAIDAKIETYNPRLAGLSGRLGIPADVVRKKLSPRQLLLQFYLGKHQAYLFALSRDSFAAYELGDSKNIDALARSFTERMRNILPLRNEARALAQAVLGPVATEIPKFSEVLFVADGTLHYVPFEALQIPGQNDLLIQSHLSSYLPSAASLTYFQSSGLENHATDMKVTVFADPVFDSTDPRLEGLSNSKTPTIIPRANKRSANYNRLSLSEFEVRSIASRLPGANTLRHTGIQASRQVFLSAASRPTNILHLATHGLVDPNRPELTGLMFSRYDAKAQPSNGFVGMRDIYSLKLDVDLVVLSACDTALGREIPGEGLLGLTRGFLYAGADRVIASLWPVLDRATATLMEHFYAARLDAGLSSAQALRSAKLAVLSETRWRHPYYWSGIVLQGI